MTREDILANFNHNRTGTGTREWSEHSFNIGHGCSNNCLYCYARANALRYKTITNPDDWTKEVVNQKAIERAGVKRNGIIMFPTTHDITPTYLEPSLIALKKMLAVGNQVLIVSKPRLYCIKRLCAELSDYKEQILFRLTIGSMNDFLLQIWEPGAPTSEERLNSLILAYENGYQTSVSMEPFLGSAASAASDFYTLEQYVREKIWIGKMNKIASRVKEDTSAIKKAVEIIKCEQGDSYIKWLYKCLKSHPKVAWKDSIKQVIAMQN